jgi:hypothetical protein
MTETNAETAMAIAQPFGMGTQPAGEGVEPASGEAGRAHDEPAAVPVSIEEQIRGVLAEITAAEDEHKRLKAQADAAYKEHVDGLQKAGWELDRTILRKSYEVGAKLRVFSDGPGTATSRRA